MKNTLTGFFVSAIMALTMATQLATPASADGLSADHVWGIVIEEDLAEEHFLNSKYADQEEAARKGTLGRGTANIYGIGCAASITVSEDSGFTGNAGVDCVNSDSPIEVDGTIVTFDDSTFDDLSFD